MCITLIEATLAGICVASPQNEVLAVQLPMTEAARQRKWPDASKMIQRRLALFSPISIAEYLIKCLALECIGHDGSSPDYQY